MIPPTLDAFHDAFPPDTVRTDEPEGWSSPWPSPSASPPSCASSPAARPRSAPTARTVAEVLDELEAAHPGFGERLFDEQGELRRFVNVFVADEDIRFLDGVDTAVADGQTVSIVPAVAGG